MWKWGSVLGVNDVGLRKWAPGRGGLCGTVTPPWGALRQCWLQDPQEGEGVGPERSLQLGEAGPWATGLQAPRRQKGWAGALGQRWTAAQTDVWQGREASRGLPGPRDVRGLQGSRPPGTHAWSPGLLPLGLALSLGLQTLPLC